MVYLAGYTPYMLNPMNYNIMTAYQNQMMQPNNMFNQPVMQNQQMPTTKQDLIGAFINSFEDVKSFPVPLGGTVMLMEKGTSKFYMKTIDNNGNPMINTYIFQDLSVPIDGKKDTVVNEEGSKNELVEFKENIGKILEDLSKKINDIETKLNNDRRVINK